MKCSIEHQSVFRSRLTNYILSDYTFVCASKHPHKLTHSILTKIPRIILCILIRRLGMHRASRHTLSTQRVELIDMVKRCLSKYIIEFYAFVDAPAVVCSRSQQVTFTSVGAPAQDAQQQEAQSLITHMRVCVLSPLRHWHVHIICCASSTPFMTGEIMRTINNATHAGTARMPRTMYEIRNRR